MADYAIFRSGVVVAKFPTKVEKLARYIIAANNSASIPVNKHFGPLVSGSERLLLEKPGNLKRSVYGFTTVAGVACEIVPGIVAGCDGGANQKEPFIWLTGASSPRSDVAAYYVITGLARDNVVTVDVMVAGKPHAARLSHNTFYFEITTARLKDVTVLKATMRDGGVITSKLPYQMLGNIDRRTRALRKS